MTNIFDLTSPAGSILVHGHHNTWLVLLSVLIAIIASTLALQLATLVRLARRNSTRQLALFSGAFTLGTGIWAMHFIGMLSFVLPVAVNYDPTLTAISLLPAFMASALALHILSTLQPTPLVIAVGGLFVGAGIGAMHYTGMFAMELDGDMRFHLGWFLASIVVAVLLAMIALGVHYGMRRHLNLSTPVSLGLSGICMGLAISGMHYTGMAGVHFVLDASVQGDHVSSPTWLAISIGMAVIVISIVVITTNGIMRYRELVNQAKSSENRLRAIVDTAVDAIITIDESGKVLTFNRAAEILFGWAEEEIRGQNVKLLMPKEFSQNHDNYLLRYQQTLQGNLMDNRREVTAMRRDGSIFPVRAGVSKAHVDGNTVYVGILTDITTRVEMEKNLKAAKARAEQAATARSTFLANMSHEIRTPMNSIIGFSELLLDTELDSNQYRHTRIIHRSARSLLRLLNDILDTAKLDRNAIELEQRPFSLKQLVQETSEEIRLLADRKSIYLTVAYECPQQWFLGDAFRIKQVITNLLSNAVKFTEEGGVIVSVTENKPGVSIVIKDTGIGIPKDRLETIFQPFSQSDVSMSRRFGGTGLGTTIAQKLVELMSGTIGVDSEEGSGSTFSIALPLKACDALQERRLTPKAEQDSGLSILAVDDVPENLELLSVNLARAGHTVDTATDGLEAIQAYKTGHYDLVLMDVQMPNLDGLSASRQIRAYEIQETLQRTPIIALTASVLERDHKAAKLSGMDGFIAKPLDWKKVYAEITNVLYQSPDDSLPDAVAKSSMPQTINHSDAIERWGNAAVYNQVLQNFLQQLPEEIDHVVKAIHTQDRDTLNQHVHRLKGITGNLGLERLYTQLESLEHFSRNSGIQVSDYSDQINELNDKVRDLLKEANLDTSAIPHSHDQSTETVTDATTSGRGNTKQTNMTLPKSDQQYIVQCLERGEIPEDKLSELIHSVDAQTAKDIHNAMDEFEFDKIIAIINTLS
ncbi:MAG: MHYT domain-containing protein [Pseudohongiella nitratireducens]|nr:MHYT domain-containing protein [Pseudohongiella nitratireducens]